MRLVRILLAAFLPLIGFCATDQHGRTSCKCQYKKNCDYAPHTIARFGFAGNANCTHLEHRNIFYFSLFIKYLKSHMVMAVEALLFHQANSIMDTLP